MSNLCDGGGQLLLRRRMMMRAMGPKEYIQFADPAVEAICVANWSSDGVGLTKADAAAVTSLNNVFKGNTSIVSFDELQYFTGVTSFGEQFASCSNLTSIIVGSSGIDTHYMAFARCANLRYAEFKGTIDVFGDVTFGYGMADFTVVFRSTTPPRKKYNTAMWGVFGCTVYVPYSADHSVLSAYQDTLSQLANYNDAIAGIYELNPDGTVPTS